MPDLDSGAPNFFTPMSACSSSLSGIGSGERSSPEKNSEDCGAIRDWNPKPLLDKLYEASIYFETTNLPFKSHLQISYAPRMETKRDRFVNMQGHVEVRIKSILDSLIQNYVLLFERCLNWYGARILCSGPVRWNVNGSWTRTKLERTIYENEGGSPANFCGEMTFWKFEDFLGILDPLCGRGSSPGLVPERGRSWRQSRRTHSACSRRTRAH